MHDERDNEYTGAESRESIGATEAEVTADLDLDAVLGVLDHPRRRYLVTTLVNGRSEAALDELAVEIASREHDKPVTNVTDAERERVHTSLHHSHVPRLVDLGIVTYDSNDESVVRAANADRVRAVLHSAGVALNSDPAATDSDRDRSTERTHPEDE